MNTRSLPAMCSIYKPRDRLQSRRERKAKETPTMNGPVLKKPKIEIVIEEDDDNNSKANNKTEEEVNQDDENEQVRKEQEETLIALIEHRTKEVEHLRTRLAYYKSQLEEAEKRLEDAQLKLARSRSRKSISTANNSLRNSVKDIKLEKRSPSHEQVGEGYSSLINQPKPKVLREVAASSKNSDGLEGRPASISTAMNLSGNSIKEIKLEKGLPSPARVHESTPIKLNHSKPHLAQEVVDSSRNSEGLGSGSASLSEHSKSFSQSQPRSKSQLMIPGMKPNQPVKTYDSISGASTSPNPQSNISSSFHGSGMVKQQADLPQRKSPQQEAVESAAKGMKRKLEIKEHKELIPLVSTKPSPTTICCHTSSLINSQHKRKLRNLEPCPTNDQLFATSALDGVVNLWQIKGRGSSANLLSTTDCVSAKQRRWPEDIAWHPEGSSLFSVYTADGGDTQLSILHLNKKKERNRVISVEEKPHTKGIINNIMFMPWEDTCFVTGGSDHAVVLWSEKDGENSWKPNVLHRNLHSSAVMGVAGMQQKKIVLSAGADKRIFGFDLTSGRTEYKLLIESKCMSILPNPCDFNLFMVQTGTPERQLRLCDIRSRHTELHDFGWKQENSESQSALINQAWSPDGLYITSGSSDPVIHIFDIRYNAHEPSQSIKAHQKRVFKAVWHYALPLMISISSDLNIGLHKIS